MTKDEFEQMYAKNSDMTVEELHSWGRYAQPCDCGSELCQGWAMGHQQEDAVFEDKLR